MANTLDLEYEYVEEDGVLCRVPYQGVKPFFVVGYDEEGLMDTSRVYFDTYNDAFKFGVDYLTRFRVGAKDKDI